MALSNFLLSVVVVGAGYMLLRSDVRRSAVTLRSNLKHIKRWLEQEAPSSDSVRYSLCLLLQIDIRTGCLDMSLLFHCVYLL